MGYIIATPDGLAHVREWAAKAKPVALVAAKAAAGTKAAKAARSDASDSLNATVIEAIGRAVVDSCSVEIVREEAKAAWGNEVFRQSGAASRVSDAVFLAEHAGERLRSGAPYWAERAEAPEGLEFQPLARMVRKEVKEAEEAKARAEGRLLREEAEASNAAGLSVGCALAEIGEAYGFTLEDLATEALAEAERREIARKEAEEAAKAKAEAEAAKEAEEVKEAA